MVLVEIAKVQASISKNAASRASGANGSRRQLLPWPKEPFFIAEMGSRAVHTDFLLKAFWSKSNGSHRWATLKSGSFGSE